jgi:catechol 2,3-dioxygenase-like lactoylglutathione lyase family enzyme
LPVTFFRKQINAMKRAARSLGLPGLQGTEHIGITVPDLEQAVLFLTNVIGCEFVFDGGGMVCDPEFMRHQLGVHPDASMRYCFLRCGRGVNFEVFEYRSPDQRTAPPRNSDIGGHHIAFYVDDFPLALEHLRSHGVEILGEPNFIETGPAAGSTWIYFKAPWGLQLELVSYPRGKGYEKNAKALLWHPGRPTR